MDKRELGEDYRWNLDRHVRADDFNKMNDVGIFAGALLSMYRTISCEELKRLMESGEKFTLLSVTPPEEYEKEHICGSINIPVPFIERDALKYLSPSDLIIVYGRDSGSASSAVAVDKLVTLAYKNVLRCQGGVEEWKKAGYCVEGTAREDRKAA
ncbi:MAG: rhodanese-like domain-containing protein [Deltaproteobacteria bacterium]|nr:rhodanese-like domain-containing protein [Deltaproteobacteria bacterium]